MILNKKERVIIVGCGRFGGKLAMLLSNRGYQVVVIDNRDGAFNKLPESFGGFPIMADGCDLDTLKYAEIDDASLFIAATGNDNVNSLLAQIASRYFGVPNVYARFADTATAKIIKDFNIQCIFPFKLSVAAFEESMFGREDDSDDEEDDDE